ncbi:splicing factor u2af subunit [Pelomyxa schiedti]|nr:splicing factor u2af subunit [Pelomyxa schiedti]
MRRQSDRCRTPPSKIRVQLHLPPAFSFILDSPVGAVVDLGFEALPTSTNLPPPQHVTWARDQFASLFVGVVAAASRRDRRAAAAADRGGKHLTVLPLDVIVEIGRRWIMGVERTVVVGCEAERDRESPWHRNRTKWFVSVSYTMGVVDITCIGRDEAALELIGWVDGSCVLGKCAEIRVPFIADLESGSVMARLGGAFTQFCKTKLIRNEGWQAAYAAKHNAVEMWKLPVQLAQIGKVVVTLGKGNQLMWMDLLSGGEGVVCVRQVNQYLLWFVDLEMTHKQGVFAVVKEFRLDTVCKGVYFSFNNGVIVTQKRLNGPHGKYYVMIQLSTKKVLHECIARPFKVDTCHFLENHQETLHSDSGWIGGISVLKVFSAEDLEQPCRVIPYGKVDEAISRYANPIAGLSPEEAALVNPSTLQASFENFYDDVHNELTKFGEVEDLVVCENHGDHLDGNVYVKYRQEEAACKALGAINGRFYAGRPVVAEFSPVIDFREVSMRFHVHVGF